MIISPPQNYVVYDNVSLIDFGVYVSGEGTFSSPERDYEVIEIPGRDGDLLFDKGRYKNVDVTYPAFILNDFRTNTDGLRNLLLGKTGYRRLEDTYHPDEYRLATYQGPLEISDLLFLTAGKFDLKFTCKPQRYIKDGEHPLTLTQANPSLILQNPSSCEARPLLRVYGTGEVGIGNMTLTIGESQNEYIDIDCDMQNCYCGMVNCNSLVSLSSGEFPKIPAGQSGVDISRYITRLIIYPRWWRL